MKKLILASTIAFVLNTPNFALAANSDQDQHKKIDGKELTHQSRELIGLGSGATAGALVAGPIGGIIGGIFGVFIANDISQDHRLAQQNASLSDLNNQLKQSDADYHSLQEQYAYLEKSQMLQLASMDNKLSTEWMHDLPNLEANIQFKTASFLVEDSYKGQLHSLAGLLNQYPSLRIQINGYADARGNSQYNQFLSEQRAKSVKDYLIQKRVKPMQIIAQGQGELNQGGRKQGDSAVNDTKEAKSNTTSIEDLFFDRRATLTLLTQGANMTAANSNH